MVCKVSNKNCLNINFPDIFCTILSKCLVWVIYFVLMCIVNLTFFLPKYRIQTPKVLINNEKYLVAAMPLFIIFLLFLHKNVHD